MSFKHFWAIVPEAYVINPSSLTKFRKLRLKDSNMLDLLISKTVSIAIENGVLKSKSIEDGIDQLTLKYKSKFKKNNKNYTLNLL